MGDAQQVTHDMRDKAKARLHSVQTTTIPIPMTIAQFFLLFLLQTIPSPSHSEIPLDWYTRYPSYPQYCSTPDQLQERRIPPLVHGPILESSILKEETTRGSDNNETTETNAGYASQLLHVTTVIRHGARTPWTNHDCWSGFWSTNASTAIWDCALTTMTSPPADPGIEFVENQQSNSAMDQEAGVQQLDGLGAMFLYEKRYDALQSPEYNLKNVLNGTCQRGQLLLRGYAQELQNGKMLRSTYIREEQNPIPEHMALFDLTRQDQHSNIRPYEEPYLYVRSDDEQRTMMSGQVLVRGMFGDLLQKHRDELAVHNGTKEDATILVHTADQSNDIMGPNDSLCPRLKDLENEAMSSSEYVKKFQLSEESKTMRNLIRDLGGNFGGSGVAQDCMMTAMCNDLDLPELLDDYGRDNGEKSGPYGKDLFNRLDKYSYQPYTYTLRYNDAAYSKLAFGPVWIEILSNILPYLRQNVQEQYNNDGTIKTKESPPKLAIFSAHDSSIHTLLATLGDEVWDGEEWAPYASLIAIELHDIINPSLVKVMKVYPSGQAFRVVYNGNVMTRKIKGCPVDSDLCDVSVLLDKVLSFATYDRACDSTYDAETVTLRKTSVDDAIIALFTTRQGMCVFLFTVLASGFAGFVGCYVVLVGRSPYRYRRPLKRYENNEALSELNNKNHEIGSGADVNRSYGTGDKMTCIT